ncbi:MAG TPA: DnaA/Hda family protein [Geobacteraceae bacterium]|nr:DnaA/Hda family protein [Geobacteraceae bacterium]
MQLVFDFPVNSKQGFADFVVCGGNNAAFQFARLLAGDPLHNVLYIYGPSGSGKTHLLRALAGSLGAGKGRATLPYISFREIDEIYGGDYPGEAVSKLAGRFLDEPALLVDDIHLMPDNIHVRTEFWQLFNDFYADGRKIAVTGRNPPRELPNLDDHLVSRLLWGLVARVDVSDDESLRMIMKKLAADRNVRLPAEVIDYLICNTRRELPALIASLESIHRYAMATKRKITLKLAREALHSALDGDS